MNKEIKLGTDIKKNEKESLNLTSMKNEKNKLTNFLKTGILLFGVSILFWNCEKDPIIEHTHESISNASKYSRTLINDLIKTDKKFSKLSKKYLVDKLNKKSFSLKNTSNNLIITSDTVSVVEEENYKSYTIRIKRSEQEYDTENLVIEEKDGVKSAYILSYDFDNEWIINRINGIHTPPKGKIYYSKYDISNFTSKTTALNKAGSCSYVTITIISPCPCEGHITSCGCYQQPTSYTTSQLVCDSGGGSENDFGSPLPTTGNGPVTGGGGGPSPNSNNPSQTQANLESMAEFIEFKLNKLVTRLELNTDQVKWVSEHTKEALDVYDFIAKENNWALEAKNFAKEVIKTKEENPNAEINLEEQIINNLTDKAKCVYDKLKGNNNLLDKTLKKFDGTESLINLLVKENNLDPGVSGETEYGIPIKITLDIDDMKYSPSLWGAHTIIHEAIHADIYRKVFVTGGLTYSPPNTFTLNGTSVDFPTLFDYYNNYPNNAHHNYMADYYRIAMEEGLKEYAASIGKIYPDQLYKDLAWAGLEKTNAWDNMYADTLYTANEQQRIKQAIINFKNSGNNECN